MRKAEFKKVIQDCINRDLKNIEAHNKALEVLTPLDGKPINKRTFNEKSLKGFKLVDKHSFFQLVGEHTSHLIGYHSDPFVSVEKFKGFDACNGSAAQTRIDKINGTNLDEAFNIFKEIDKAFNKLQTLFGDLERAKLDSFNFPPYYDALNLVSNDDEHIRISSFYFIKK